MSERRGAHVERDPLGIKSLTALLREGQAAVPAVRYAVGIVGIAAAGGIVNIILGHTRASVISIALMFVAMVILFVFSRLVTSGASASVKAAANVLLWVVVLLFSAGLILCLTAVAFKVPEGMHDFLLPEKELSNAELIERVMLKDTIDDSRDAMDELAKRCPNNCDDKQKIIKAILFSLTHTPKTERELKVTAIAALRVIVGNDLEQVLSDEFEKSHVVEVDFSRTNLSRTSFRSSFAILDNFAFADLSGTDFSDANLRGSNFRNTKFFQTKMNNADWFNSFNLEIDQLSDMKGLKKCPHPYNDVSLQAFISENDNMYKNKFIQYDSGHQDELRKNWKKYAGPGSACDFAENQK